MGNEFWQGISERPRRIATIKKLFADSSFRDTYPGELGSYGIQNSWYSAAKIFLIFRFHYSQLVLKKGAWETIKGLAVSKYGLVFVLCYGKLCLHRNHLLLGT